MSEEISWTVSGQVIGGPKLAESATTGYGAYEKIKVTVPVGRPNVTAELQPSGTNGDKGLLRFLLITSSLYGPDIKYRVMPLDVTVPVSPPAEGANSSIWVPLDQIQLLMEGILNLFDVSPQKIEFQNDLEEATIDIIVARDVIVT